MEILETALYFWNDWIIGTVALCMGILFWFYTRRPSALVMAIGTIFMFLSTVMGVFFKAIPARAPLSYFYGGASEAVGLLGAGLLAIGLIWCIVRDRKAVLAGLWKWKRRGSVSS